MTTATTRLWSALALVLGLALGASLLAPAPAFAQSPETGSPAADADAEKRASAHFRRGVALYNDGDYRAALIEFKRAYQVAPNYNVLFNLGQASFELKDYVAALQAFEQYLAEGGDRIKPKRRKMVEGEIAKLKPRIARLTVTVDVAGAEVLVDDVVRGQSPLGEPLVVSAGRRKIGVTKTGHVPTQRYVDVAGGEEASVELSLAPVGAGAAPAQPAPPPQPTPPPDEPTASDSNVGLWVSLAVTGALAIATGVVGGLALAADGDYQDQLDTYPSSQQQIDDDADQVQTLALTADILGAATGGAVVVTVLLAVLGGGDEAEADEPATSVRWVPAPGGLGVQLAF